YLGNASLANVRYSTNLEQLSDYEFKKFKMKLPDVATKHGKKTIPKGKMDSIDACDMTTLMISYYPKGSALEITKEILESINNTELEEHPQTNPHSPVSPKSLTGEPRNMVKCGLFTKTWDVKCTQQYKEEVKQKHQRFKHYNDLHGEWRYINDCYIRLLMTKKNLQRKDKENFIESVGDQHIEYCITPEQLFKADKKKEETPKTVVLQGAAGIGKSFTIRKIMVDWASDKIFKGAFDFVFYLNCKEISGLANKITVADLILSNSQSLKPIIKEVLNLPEKILIIVESFDELKFSLGTNNEDTDDSEWKEQPLEIAVSKLLKRKVLPKTSILITTRPGAVDKLPQELVIDRYAEIVGFSGEGREKYFRKFFNNEHQAATALTIFRRNDIMFTMCFVPTVCWIVCTVLKQFMENGGDLLKDSKTATHVLASYVNIIQTHHIRSKEDEDVDLCKKLGALALHGVKKQKILFDQKDLERFSFRISEVPSCFLNKMVLEMDENVGTVYSFAHLRLQEFFAAFYCVEYEINELQTILQDFLHERKPYLNSTITFIFGFANTETAKKTNCHSSSQLRSTLLEWNKEAFINQKDYNLLQMLHCLYEANEDTLTKSTMQDLTDIDLSTAFLQEINCIAVNYCVLNCHKLEKLNLSKCKLGSKEIKVLLSAFKKSLILQRPNRAQALLKHLVHKLVKYQSNNELVSKLDNRNSMNKMFLLLLSEGSGDPNEILKNVRLLKCGLTAGCCTDLSTILSKSPSLTELDLRENSLGDSGMKLLSAGLMTPKCKVQTLELAGCDLTADCCGDLFSILSTSPNLTELDLNYNHLGDLAVKLLSAVLKDTGCKLQRMRLGECGLTAACCADLSSVLSTNPILIELELKNNKLGDSGVNLLSIGMKDPTCKLQKLGLGQCDLTTGCCGDLSSVLSSSSNLRELDLRNNNLGNSGVKLLSAALRDPNCKLQKLVLQQCDLTASCCEDLSTILSINSSLAELDLKKNNLGDLGEKLL
uniref:NACHT, LRR and PYD domains-containing protein 3 n=1 Tax=Latimeria chalumnae TaxID=7897 RepID=H2ZSP9_LATCH